MNVGIKKVWVAYLSQKPRVDGAVILVCGIALLTWAGVLSTSRGSPPTTPELAVLLAASAVLQVYAGVTFGKVGHVDAAKARSAVRRLITVGVTTGELRGGLLAALKTGTLGELRNGAIRADEGLSGLSKHVQDAIADWTDIHPEALQSVLAAHARQDRRARDDAGAGT